MENMMHIGANLSKETAENASNAIKVVFESGFQNHVSETVMLKALDTLKSAVTVQNITVSGCSFDSSQTKEVNIVIPEEYDVNMPSGCSVLNHTGNQ